MLQRLALPLTLAFSLAVPAVAHSAPSGGRHATLIHGNYCGPGNNAPAAPVDVLDAACARHDACTPDGGLASETCNVRLEREADAISRDPRQPDDLRAMAGLVAVGASMMLSSRDPEPSSGVAEVPNAWAAYGR